MSLIEHIKTELKTAMKAKEKTKVTVIRNLQAAIKKIEIDNQTSLSEPEILEVIQKQIKQRKESLTIYKDNGREDLAEKEQQEIDALTEFLPQALSEEELLTLVKQEIANLNAEGMKDMGKVMGVLKEKTVGKAEPATISKLVKQQLSQ